MSEYLIQDTTLISIADALREKTGKSDLIPVTNLAEEIKNLPSGSTDFAKQVIERTITTITAKDLEELGLTSIGNNAFYKCKSLTSVEIPDSITSIEDHAFGYCDMLLSIKIPNSITDIKTYTFQNCKSLTSVEIPESVTSIGSNAFYYCESLTSIEIPEGVTSIGSNGFSYCKNLNTVIMKPINPPTITISAYGSTFHSSVTTFIVPKGYGDVYKSATNWSTLASKIVEAEE
jgi:hypothetical protein